MSQHKAGVAIYDMTTGMLNVRTLKGNDSHEAIRREFSIRDAGAAGTRQAAVTLLPGREADLLTPDERWLLFVEDKPDWWTDSHSIEARRQLEAAAAADWSDGRLVIDGDLWLEKILRLPAAAEIVATGDIYLGSVCEIPSGVMIRCKDLVIGQVVRLADEAQIVAENIYYKGAWKARKE